MSSVIELLSGIVRFFPNTLIVALFVVGVALGKIAWILIALGAVLAAGIVLTIQYVFTKGFQLGEVKDADILAACTLLPMKTDVMARVPSLWVSLTAFFAVFITMNAYSVYTTPAQTPPGSTVNMNDVITVQQRKGVGLISMLATLVLVIFLMIARGRGSCETLLGGGLGLAIGGLAGYFWWSILAACGKNVYPDIHGIMIGLQPGPLRTGGGAVACKAAATP